MGCSYCLCRTVSPTSIRPYEYPLLLVLIRPYQCDHWAQHRFYRLWPLQAILSRSTRTKSPPAATKSTTSTPS